MNWRIGFAAATIVAVLCVVLFRGGRDGVDVGFWYEEFPFTFSEPVTAALGGPLTASEIDAIKHVSRDELTRAFSGLKIAFTDSRHARLTVVVQLSIQRRKGQRLPNAGETFAMGPLGGRSLIDFTEVLMAAMAHAPPARRASNSSRESAVASAGWRSTSSRTRFSAPERWTTRPTTTATSTSRTIGRRSFTASCTGRARGRCWSNGWARNAAAPRTLTPARYFARTNVSGAVTCPA